ncbi:signal recognition 54 kDa protein [Methanocella paludicola SANAE]|uniref:Signal recognition particle 54 kDa protein n=1 Tax=Methanocella paludicola (strain DSM 17711 / JCM 13418 / NBRC 101707 / SANAE) TaxID=304371 RepID=D1Z205_METPS|nr:signal recognition particle protein Srp54 [Methanocella paludicola]BAI62727.1 signal recognition 54 kDa protein [Methanocella paludicola SANAE]
MVLDNLGSSLKSAIQKLANAGKIDKEIIDDVVKDIQRALIQADVNVKLVMKLSNRIKERALTEAPPAGMDSREHVLRIVYTELVNIIGKATPIALEPQTIMMVGLQGSGKTTTTAKLARFFSRKGLKPAVICADTYRPGAYDQLSQLCEKLGVMFYGERDNKDAVAIVRNGLKETQKYDVRIVDTAGRHALETELIKEMKDIWGLTNFTHRFLVLDAAIGQQASEQAKAFNDAVGITGVVITKLDGTAKGGGALSAVSDTNTSIAFIGVGETPDDLERFDPDGFISRLLGMGDLKALVEKANEVLSQKDVNVEKMMTGKFTLNDMYSQLEAINKMGPLKQIMSMLPLGGLGNIPDDAYRMTQDKMQGYRIIMDSMTEDEKDDPKLIGSSRIARIAMGSGRAPEDVRELLKYHKMMQKAMKGMKGGGQSNKNLKKIMKQMNIK